MIDQIFWLSSTLMGGVVEDTLDAVGIYLCTAHVRAYCSQLLQFSLMQIWNLCIALFAFACFFTCRTHGPQPAACGHIQTLANLVDEWLPVMWWGRKEDGVLYCHAGRLLVWPRGWCIDTLNRDK